MRIGVDSGGTFTDFVVLHDDGRVESFKLRSNPKAAHEVIVAGLETAAGRKRADVIHGSTVATNALLERKGARTAFVTTAGFEDLLEIGRQHRARLYDLTPPPKRLLVPGELCFGVDERSYADGTIARKPSQAALKRLRSALKKAGVQSVAVCFLHAYRTPQNEAAAAEALGGAFYLSSSHEVCPEFREYERASTTALNAYVGPLMQAYLGELGRSRHWVSVMQSNGGSITWEEAGRQAVRTILSGPAGGVVGALAMAKASGYSKIIGFDMGGTSTDVCLCEGTPRETTEAYVDGLPIRVPMLEIHTVGAGGGSIARVDEGGLMRVGPESAGADPGPACYGTGDLPTVTDAHVVLGRIGPDQFLGGAMHLDVERAGRALDKVAAQSRVDREAAAAGVLRIANANMERAIRVVSVERGYDPRDFALVAFGGCGGLHACEIAEQLGIGTVVVPRLAGALSALGMLIADRVRDYAAGVLGRSDYEQVFRELERRNKWKGARLDRSADVRYKGQSYELTVPWNAKDPGKPFHAAHQKTYGYSDRKRPVEVVTLRVRARVAVAAPRLTGAARGRKGRPEIRRFFAGARWVEAGAWRRDQIGAGAIAGPALVLDYGSTTLVPDAWRFRVDRSGNLVIVATSVGTRRH
jgi:N-methylhydantoinase A